MNDLSANHDKNLKALEKAIGGTITLEEGKGKAKTKREVKGHVICDIYHLHDTKRKGLTEAELVEEGKLVEASHAFHMTKNYPTTHKAYVIKETKAEEKAD